MDLKFEKRSIPYLNAVAWDVQRQEQTQEIRLPENMPDAGQVLGCWGQPVLRSKEWRSGGMWASGGVMAWVLYAPEDGSQPRWVDCWIPFQLKWEFPQSGPEGTMNISCQLRSADARIVSARKLMVRICVNGLGVALEPGEAEQYIPSQVPEDVLLLRRAYPLTVPVEAGEKNVQLDEELQLPQNLAEAGRLVRYDLRPRIREKKLLGERLVFRGAVEVHFLMIRDDGRLVSGDLEVPFSQFTDLEQERSQDAAIQIQMVLTAAEAEADQEGRFRLKASFAAQYIVWERLMLELVQDAYSTRREIKLAEEVLHLPVLLEERRETVACEHAVPIEMSALVDVAYLPDKPELDRNGDRAVLEIPGTVQILYYNGQGNLQGTTVSCAGRWETQADSESRLLSVVEGRSQPQVTPEGDGAYLRGEVEMTVRTMGGSGIPMVTGMELGEIQEPDQGRPSLILRRSDAESLWEMAKASGSTVDAILRANGLVEEPGKGKMLLIPVQ